VASPAQYGPEHARGLGGRCRSALELILEHGDPEFPRFVQSLSETIKYADNPDNLHLNARIRGDLDYRIRGSRGTVGYVAIGCYAGSFGGGRTVAYHELDEFEIEPNGHFELALSEREHSGNWIPIDRETNAVLIRQTFLDRSSEVPATFEIQRSDAPGPPPPLDPAYIVRALRSAARNVSNVTSMLAEMSDEWQTRPNHFWATDAKRTNTTQGIPGMYYSGGYWKLLPDEAIVIDFDPPRCRFWNLVLANYWQESLDFRYRPIHYNKQTALYRADGSVRFVIADRNPGLSACNWLDPEGHREGVWTLRCLLGDAPPAPRVRVVRGTELG
jgi:hypothetical protein